MARSRVSHSEAVMISARLREMAVRRYGSWEGFYKKLGISRTTAEAWKGKSPSVPDPLFLIQLAREANINLNWLLLGRGHELFEYQPLTAGERVENAIEAELRNSEDATMEEFNAAWDLPHFRPDFSMKEDQVLPLAVAGVRTRFQEYIRLIRHYARVMGVINTIPRMLEQARDDPERARVSEQVVQLVRQAMAPDALGSSNIAPNAPTTGKKVSA